MKNKAILFFLSILPGIGHMYLGYMKRGIQISGTFCAFIWIAFMSAANDMDIFSIPLSLAAVILWFYSFFDGFFYINDMRKCGFDPSLYIPDGFTLYSDLGITAAKKLPSVSNHTSKVLAVGMIIAGVSLLLFNVTQRVINIFFTHSDSLYIVNSIYNVMLPCLIALILLIIGIRMLAGKNTKNGGPDGGES